MGSCFRRMGSLRFRGLEERRLKKPMKHPVITNQKIVDKVVSRRGRLHAFESIRPENTALVVVDMMRASVDNDPQCQAIIPSINRLAQKLRDKRGAVAWVTVRSEQIWDNHVAVFGEEIAQTFHERAQADDSRSRLPNSLTTCYSDIHASKLGFSAFFPGRSDLHEQLEGRGIDTVLICGTVTNVCCESSARDAVELGYRVIMVSDLNVGHGHGLHEAALTTFYRTFGDVRPLKEVVQLLAGKD